ncbi:MAG: hypothetical protein FJW37_15035 [Acidobacteria bacterium]|nr:hypothetical protein [Acidobacteriota bacterium]
MKVSRVSEGILTFGPLVRTCTAAPAPAPAVAPMAAPLPPPATAPMMAPRAAPPPTLRAVLPVRDSLCSVTSVVFTSTVLPFTSTETTSSFSSERPVRRPAVLSSTSFTTTLAPRGITVSPSTITGSSRVARNSSPRRFTSESTGSTIRTVSAVSAGISTASRLAAEEEAGSGRKTLLESRRASRPAGFEAS